MSSANERQIGGQHYSSTYQHWDWVVDVRLAYHPGNASKYLARWRKKNGLPDLEKAVHYLDKTIEINKSPSLNKMELEGARFLTARFCQSNGLTDQESAAMQAIVIGQYGKAKDIISVMILVVKEQPVSQPG